MRVMKQRKKTRDVVDDGNPIYLKRKVEVEVKRESQRKMRIFGLVDFPQKVLAILLVSIHFFVCMNYICNSDFVRLISRLSVQ